MAPQCLYCAEHLFRDHKEGLRDWKKRIYCNKKCRALDYQSKRRPLFWRNDDAERRCVKCRKWKTADGTNFKKDKRKRKGIAGICRECLRESAYQLHRGTEGTWTKEEKQQAFNTQQGKCAICGKSFLSWTKAKADHCHKMKIKRGLLCDRCNRGLGFFNDDIQTFQSVIQYLQRHSPLTISL